MSDEGQKGFVSIAGSGPLDEDLATVKLIRVLHKADVVLYDHLIAMGLLEHCRDETLCIDVGKTARHREARQTEQDSIHALLKQYADQGKFIVRLKGGDPTLFGRCAEECEFLDANHIPFEIIPGISSVSACSAYAGIPLTHREMSRTVAFATGHLQRGTSVNDIPIPRADTIVFLMGIKNLPVLVKKLYAEGYNKNTPCALVERGASAKQRVITGTLKDVCALRDQHQIQPPALFIVGEVIHLRKQMSWYEQQPLFGKKIVVTRPKGQSRDMIQRLSVLGADVLERPVICFQAVDAGIQEITHARTWDSVTDVIFTSRTAVTFLFQAIQQAHQDSRIFAGRNILCVGPGTAHALSKVGLTPDIIPEDFQQEGLLAQLETRLDGRVFLFPCSQGARETLGQEIRHRGGIFREIILYKTCPLDTIAPIDDDVDAIIFTSASTVRAFCRQFEGFRSVPVFALGPITAASLHKQRFKNIHTSEKASTDHLIHKLCESIL